MLPQQTLGTVATSPFDDFDGFVATPTTTAAVTVTSSSPHASSSSSAGTTTATAPFDVGASFLFASSTSLVPDDSGLVAVSAVGSPHRLALTTVSSDRPVTAEVLVPLETHTGRAYAPIDLMCPHWLAPVSSFERSKRVVVVGHGRFIITSGYVDRTTKVHLVASGSSELKLLCVTR
jgi:hypothetical protein